MRDPKRIDEALKILGHYWKKHPDLRLGQLLCNVTEDGLEDSSKLYYVEDEYLMIAIMMRYGSVEDKKALKKKSRFDFSMFIDFTIALAASSAIALTLDSLSLKSILIAPP